MSELDVCNRALTALGADYISSVTEDSVAARLCQTYLKSCNESLLATGQFEFAINYITFNETDSIDVGQVQWGYTFAFPLDPAYIGVVKLSRTGERNVRDANLVDWAIYNGHILTNTAPVWALLVENIPIDEITDPIYLDLLAARVAYELCVPITKNVELKTLLYTEYTNKLHQARGYNTANKKRVIISSNSLVVPRITGGGLL
jgi:hypothetical protein